MSSYENSSLTEIEALLDGLEEPTSLEVFDATRPYASRAIAAVAASRTSFPPAWTIGVNGELTIETGVAAGSPLEIVLPDDQTAPGIVIRNEQGTYLFRAGGSTHGIEMTADPAGLVSRFSLDEDSFAVEDENGEVMIDIQGGYINLGDGGKIAAGPTDVYIGGPTDTVGFYGGAGVAKQTGVAVTVAAVHAALVNLGLITA